MAALPVHCCWLPCCETPAAGFSCHIWGSMGPLSWELHWEKCGILNIILFFVFSKEKGFVGGKPSYWGVKRLQSSQTHPSCRQQMWLPCGNTGLIPARQSLVSEVLLNMPWCWVCYAVQVVTTSMLAQNIQPDAGLFSDALLCLQPQEGSTDQDLVPTESFCRLQACAGPKGSKRCKSIFAVCLWP